MLTLTAENLGKRYIRQWVFRRLQHHFRFGEPCAITGPNGSGKSTLLKVLSGFQPATEGTVNFTGSKAELIPAEKLFEYVSLAAPYLDLIEDFTLAELLKFHYSFKRVAGKMPLEELAEKMYLYESWKKPIKHFSSGMKQRLKLGLAFYADTPLLLLDEPTSNLDEQGQQWYEQEIKKVIPAKMVIIASNQKSEYHFCADRLHLPDWK